MRAVLTCVKSASVTVDGREIANIGKGFLILLGVTHEDTEAQAVKLADKLMGLRVFEDENGKMNRRKGRRPEFLAAARPEVAVPLYEKFVALCRDKGFRVQTGEFGAYMDVASVNDGPMTLIVDTDLL